MRFSIRATTAAALAVGASLVASTGAGATSTGSCPSGDSWTLVAVADLGIPPEEASGIPSLDGNGDGMTCIKPGPTPNGPQLIFRDNTVQGP
jgi:hypothetical protein